MKTKTAAPNVALLCGFGLLVLLITAPASAATVSIGTPASTVGLDAQITLDLNISGLTSSQALGAFDISVNFNSSLLSFQSLTFGDPVLGDQLDLSKLGLNSPNAVAGNGTVDLIETDLLDSPSTLLSSQPKNFTLAALTFYGLAAGTAPLTVTVNSLADQNGNPFTATLINSSVTVSPSPVPLPAAAWMLLSGLGGLGALARKNRST